MTKINSPNANAVFVGIVQNTNSNWINHDHFEIVCKVYR